MQPTRWRLLAAASLLCVFARGAAARPVYGGTIRLQTRAASIEPARNFLLNGLVYEHLTRFSASGELAPELATAWREEPGARRWRFYLRPNVRFHDGSAVDANAAAAILQPLNPAWRWSVEGDALVVTLDRAAPWLPAELAQPAFAISRTGPDGLPVATGPFRITRLDPEKQATLAANTAHWVGRPFVDAIELTLNRTPREQSVDFELRRADVVELSATEFRRATQAGRTVTSSLPKQLIALRIAEQVDPVVRRALALSIDRASMHSVLLQRQGEVAASLLPQWLSGYAFVFPAAPDAARARQMLASARLAPVTVFADPGDTILKSIADRIAVNARDVGITVRVVTTQAPAADARMERVAIDTPSPALALAQFTLAPPEGDAQSIYAAESRLLETNLVIPLFHLPQSWLWSPRIRVWLRPAEGRDGALNLAGAWILEERNRP